MARTLKRLYTMHKYYMMNAEEKKELLERFRPILEKHSKEWGQSLSKRKAALELNMADGLSSYLSTIVERVEPLKNENPPDQYLVRRSFERLPPEMQNEIGNRIKKLVMDRMVNATERVRLIEVEKEVSRETRISLSLVRDFSPSFDMVQRKKKAM